MQATLKPGDWEGCKQNEGDLMPGKLVLCWHLPLGKMPLLSSPGMRWTAGVESLFLEGKKQE